MPRNRNRRSGAKPRADGGDSGQATPGSTSPTPGPSPGGCAGKKPPKAVEKINQLDCKIHTMVLSVYNKDLTAESKGKQVRDVMLVDFFKRNTESWYPRIGKATYRVPPIHINKGKDNHHQMTDGRGDRAHVFLVEMLEYLSQNILEKECEQCGPMFIISSYEYDNFLSRLRAQFEDDRKEIHYPGGSGSQRGEIDIMIVLDRHVVFVQIKSVGDNFRDYADDSNKKGLAIFNAVSKAIKQLERDKKVFNFVMEDINVSDFEVTKVTAMPNLSENCMEEARRSNQKLEEIMSDRIKEGDLFMYKESMPVNRFAFMEDFDKFKDWWLDKVLLKSKPKLTKIDHCPCEISREDESHDRAMGNGGTEGNVGLSEEVATPLSTLEKLKIIVGRYVGIISTIPVSTASSATPPIEVRRVGQGALFTAHTFSEIVLTNQQLQYLNENVQLGYLCGPPGSGKTVVLAQKAKRWITYEENMAVVVNMYRGSKGRAIGKHLYHMIRESLSEKYPETLKKNCMELTIDVDKFDEKACIEYLREEWPDVMTDDMSRILFLVDETYVQSYWINVFNMLTLRFPLSSFWCAGLYGSRPEKFTNMMLSKVIRCPPKIQRLLMQIDWVKERKECYVKDSTEHFMATDGPDILTIRHEHHESPHITPYMCKQCGKDLAVLFKDILHVKKSMVEHEAVDLKEWTLKASDIVILVNMPKSDFKKDKNGYMDTCKDKFEAYMSNLVDCPLLQELVTAGYKTNVYQKLSDFSLASAEEEVIKVAWIYMYQGLECKVVVFVPGDQAMTSDMAKDPECTEPKRNIPCPGLRAANTDCFSLAHQTSPADRQVSAVSQPDSNSIFKENNTKSPESDPVDICTTGSPIPGRTQEQSPIVEEQQEQSPTVEEQQEQSPTVEEQQEQSPTVKEQEQSPTVEEQEQSPTVEEQQEQSPTVEEQAWEDVRVSSFVYKTEDVSRYTRWDTNNLFISASRCTSQLILISR